MKHMSLFFVFVLLISLVFRESFAIPDFFRILAHGDQSPTEPRRDQISPSPSPAAAFNLDNSGQQVSRSTNGDTITKNACDEVSRKCSVDGINITACIPHAAKGPQESRLIVVNNGENLQQLNITFSPKQKTYKHEVPEHKVKEINISSDIGGSSSVVLTSTNWSCAIPMGASIPTGSYYFPSYTTHVTPIYGAYFLAMVGLILGGTFFCCKFWKRERHLNGVPYQELELGEQGSLSSVKVESATGWDEDWDDDWDEEKAVKSPGSKHLANRLANGSNQWGNDWDD